MSKLTNDCNVHEQQKSTSTDRGLSIFTSSLFLSGTSIGANIREASYAHGRADFIAKLQIAWKECSESAYWLELLMESGDLEDAESLNPCMELKNCGSAPSAQRSEMRAIEDLSFAEIKSHVSF